MYKYISTYHSSNDESLHIYKFALFLYHNKFVNINKADHWPTRVKKSRALNTKNKVYLHKKIIQVLCRNNATIDNWWPSELYLYMNILSKSHRFSYIRIRKHITEVQNYRYGLIFSEYFWNKSAEVTRKRLLPSHI